MSFRFLLPLLVVGAHALPLSANDDLTEIQQLNQSEFRALSEDLGAAVSYKAVIPVASLGIAGFDIGAAVSATRIENRAAWGRASGGQGPSALYMPKVYAHKGLPGGFDVGAFYTTVLDTNIDIWGAELRYAVVDGSVAVPAVGVRATYSRITGVEQLELDTKGVELGISKGFALVTPYAGVGRVWTEAVPVGTAAGLQTEKFSDTKVFAGAAFNLLFGSLTLEADRVGEVVTYSVKLGVGF